MEYLINTNKLSQEKRYAICKLCEKLNTSIRFCGMCEQTSDIKRCFIIKHILDKKYEEE